MAYLRISRVKSRERKLVHGVVGDRQFTTRKACAEYVFRALGKGSLSEGKGYEPNTSNQPIGAQRLYSVEGGRIERTLKGGRRVRGGVVMRDDPIEIVTVKDAPERKRKPAKAGPCFSVRCVHGVYRRYLISKEGRRWISDHVSQDDALAGRNAIADHSNVDRSNTVNQRADPS